MKPKIIFVNAGQLIDGEVKTSTFVKTQAQSLSERYDIEWFLLENNSSLSKITAAIKKLKQIIQQQPGIQLIHAHYGSITSFIAARATDSTPLVVSYCGDDLLGTVQPGIKWRIREALAKRFSYYSAENAAAIIVKSKNLLEALPAKNRVKATIIPNGVDTTLFKPGDQQEAKRILGFAPNINYVLFNGSSGNNIPVKNRPLAEATLKLVQETCPNTQLIVVNKLSQAELVLHMQASDALILTSLHEGSPNIVKEAMACNLPVVSVNCGDVSERLAQVNMGGYFDYDPNNLATALIEVFNQDAVYNGREELFQQGLDQESTAQKVDQIYRSTI